MVCNLRNGTAGALSVTFQFPLHWDVVCNKVPLLPSSMLAVTFSSLFIGMWSATKHGDPTKRQFQRLSVPSSLGCGLQPYLNLWIQRAHICFQFPLHWDVVCNLLSPLSPLVPQCFQFPLHWDVVCNGYRPALQTPIVPLSVPSSLGCGLQLKKYQVWQCYPIAWLSVPSSLGCGLQLRSEARANGKDHLLSVPSSLGCGLQRRRGRRCTCLYSLSVPSSLGCGLQPVS